MPAAGPGSRGETARAEAGESLAPVAAALLDAARSEAAEILSRAADEARAVVERAQRQADAVVAVARSEAERAAGREAMAARGSAHRQAHQLVMSARARAYWELRRRCLAEAEGLALGTDYEEVLAGLETMARRVLGGSPEMLVDGPGQRGVMAISGDRRVDLRLATLVDRALVDLGPAVEELWR